MDNGIYVALSRQIAVFRDLDVTANNLANTNTIGFTSEDLLHTSFSVDAGNQQKVDFQNPVSTYRRLEPGAFRTTGNDLDAAIIGPGYFTVQTPLGDRYTRAGHFQLDSNGVLITPNGYPVLDNSGQTITFDPADTNITIGANGNIGVNGVERAILGVSTFANEQALVPVGDGVFRADAPPSPNPQDGSITVSQGTLEESNAQPIKQLTHLVELQRSVAITTSLINGMYDLQQRTSRTLSQQNA